MTEILIGSGDYIISGIEQNQQEGIRIASAKNHGNKIDSVANKQRSEEAPDLCRIWFKNLNSARMFQDQVNSVCLRLNGYQVDNA